MLEASLLALLVVIWGAFVWSRVFIIVLSIFSSWLVGVVELLGEALGETAKRSVLLEIMRDGGPVIIVIDEKGERGLV